MNRQHPARTVVELRQKLENKDKLDLLRGFEWGFNTARTPQGLEMIIWNNPEFLERVIEESEYEVGGVATHLNCVVRTFQRIWDEENWQEKLNLNSRRE